MTLTAFLLALGLVARLVRLFTSDPVLRRARDWLDDRYGPHSLRAYLLGCPWTSGLLVAPPVLAWAHHAGDSPAFVITAAAAAASYLVGLAAINLDDDLH
ncbi:hypothetical protein [Nonomuraea sp. NPDC049646]|uniref:hypothetical protein n=1 Tax=unclassified Nonomuraea TaxID=2593643 RepID=UPI003790FF73